MLWRTISKALPTRSRLLTRGMDIDPHCPRCPTEEETINHVLFTCPYAASIWSLSNFPWLPGHTFSQDTEENISFLINSFSSNTLNTEQRLAPFWLIWRLWKARNNLVFNKFNESCSRVVTQTEAEVNEWLQDVNRREEASDLKRSSQRANVRWKKPVFPLVKCNFNAGFTGNNTQRTGGWIIRDHAGLAKAWGSSIVQNVTTALEAETKALLIAMQQAWVRGYKCVQFEGDCEILIKAINGAISRCEITSLLRDVDFWASRFSNVVFTFTNRLCNNTAHLLASPLNSCYMFQSNSGYQPLWLKNSLCKDLLI